MVDANIFVSTDMKILKIKQTKKENKYYDKQRVQYYYGVFQ